MLYIKMIAGIVGAILLVSAYSIAQTESVTPKLGAAPESDKNIGPEPSGAKSGSDKKMSKSKNPRSKNNKQARGDKSKSQPAVEP